MFIFVIGIGWVVAIFGVVRGCQVRIIGLYPGLDCYAQNHGYLA